MRSSVLLLTALCACAGSEGTMEFSAAEPMSAPTLVGTAPMFAVAPNGAEAAAWVSAPDSSSDGRLYISIDGAAPVELRDTLGPIEAHGEAPPKIQYGPDGTLHAIYVVGKEVPDRRFPLAALRYVHSADGGRTWSEPVTVTDDDTFGSHNFHALHAAADGTVFVSWLDGREGKSAAYVTRSTDGGASWSANQRVAAGEACPCCRTALATAPDGTLFLAWRTAENNIRDIVIATSRMDSLAFTQPKRVHADNWNFDGCPHAGPSMQLDEQGRLHIAWWTGKADAPGVYYAHSDDAAGTFSSPVFVGASARPAHVQLAVSGERVLLTWDESESELPRVQFRQSRDRGETFAPTVTLSDAKIAATFPVMAVSKGAVTVAWSEKSAAALHGEAHPDMKDPKARMPLAAVGDARVMARRARLDAGD